jgi:hypothetical protein
MWNTGDNFPVQILLDLNRMWWHTVSLVPIFADAEEQFKPGTGLRRGVRSSFYIL